MFWRYGGFANVSTIDTLLEQSDVTLEDILDESDLIQELKQHNTKLLQYFRSEEILKKLFEYVVAPKLEVARNGDQASETKEDGLWSAEYQADNSDEDLKEKQRNRYAYVAAEVLSSDNWSICGSLLENLHLLKKFWDFLKTSPPLDPLQASYFTKVNEALLDKKTEEMLNMFKSCDNVVENMLRHIDSPMIMDLLLKIISLERAEGGQGIIDWLYGQNLMPLLLSFLSSEHSWATQTSAGDFLKAIITISANTPQIQQSCVGPNELTRQLVSEPCVDELISYMLKGGNPLTVGVGIVIEVIRKNNSDYDPCIDIKEIAPSSRDPIYLGTLLRLFTRHVPDFMAMMITPENIDGDTNGKEMNRRKLNTAFGEKIEPLGFDRFKICELLAELLHCSNMALLNDSGSETNHNWRDRQREELRKKGQLENILSVPTNISRTGEVKKLHIQNASDDDGFERVNNAGDDDTSDLGNLENQVFKETVDANHTSELSSLNSNKVTEDESILPVLNPSPVEGISNKIDLLRLEGKNNIFLTHKVNDESATLRVKTDAVDKEVIQPSHKSCQNIHDTEISSEVPGTDETHEEEEVSDKLAPKTLTILDAPGDLSKNNIHIQEDKEHESKETSTEMSEEFDMEAEIKMSRHLWGKAELYPVGDFLKQQFVKYSVIPTILGFFFRFPWNNFLHNVVYDIVQQVFNGPAERSSNQSLALDLFETGDITMKIVNGQKESDKMSKMRLGYMGHLTLIAEEVVKFTGRNPEIFPNALLYKIMNNEWISYVEVTLAETRERDNAILGGYRPSKPSSNQRPAGTNMAGSFGTVLADANLNGFGSNEEEDDEMAAAEYITDFQPPASPPPLPSLLIPPSRARLQFAARLALHKPEKDEDESAEDNDIGVSITTEAKKRTTLDDGESYETLHASVPEDPSDL